MIIDSKNNENKSLDKEIDLTKKDVKMLSLKSRVFKKFSLQGIEWVIIEDQALMDLNPLRRLFLLKYVNYPFVNTTNKFARTSGWANNKYFPKDKN